MWIDIINFSYLIEVRFQELIMQKFWTILIELIND